MTTSPSALQVVGNSLIVPAGGLVDGVDVSTIPGLISAVAAKQLALTNQTTSATAAANSVNVYGALGAAATLTLPGAPSDGDVVVVFAPSNAATWNLTVARNGHTINGAASDDTLAVNLQSRAYTYSSTNGWRYGVQTTGAVNLAGGGGSVTGVLPAANVDPLASGTAVYAVDILCTSTNNVTVATLPKKFVASAIFAKVKTAILGGGSFAFTVGLSAGGTEFIQSQTIDGSKAVDAVVGGLTLASLGAAFAPTNGSLAEIANGAAIVVAGTKTGTITAGALTIYVAGTFLP